MCSDRASTEGSFALCGQCCVLPTATYRSMLPPSFPPCDTYHYTYAYNSSSKTMTNRTKKPWVGIREVALQPRPHPLELRRLDDVRRFASRPLWPH